MATVMHSQKADGKAHMFVPSREDMQRRRLLFEWVQECGRDDRELRVLSALRSSRDRGEQVTERDSQPVLRRKAVHGLRGIEDE